MVNGELSLTFPDLNFDMCMIVLRLSRIIYPFGIIQHGVLVHQIWYNHDITILLQPCSILFTYIMTVSDLLQQTCNKSDSVIKLVTSS